MLMVTFRNGWPLCQALSQAFSTPAGDEELPLDIDTLFLLKVGFDEAVCCLRWPCTAIASAGHTITVKDAGL